MSWLRRSPSPTSESNPQQKYWLDMAMRMIKPQITDEAVAFKTYTDIANALKGAGKTRLADQVLAIARDEDRHRVTLEDIQRELARG